MGLLYLRDGPPIPTEGPPMLIESLLCLQIYRSPMSTEGLICQQTPMPAEDLLHLQKAFSTYRGPDLPTEDLIYLQRTSFTYIGASFTQRGLGMFMEGPPVSTEGLL